MTVETTPAPGPQVRALLVEALTEARGLGALGPGPVEEHVERAEAWAAVLSDVVGSPESVVDLGTGAGVPGLVLAACWPEARVLLVDARQRRTEWLVEVLPRFGWGARVAVRTGRAEELARETELRERFEVVVARGFGPPPVTAECLAPFARPGGVVSVSEPPEDRATVRWPAEQLATLGLGVAEVVRTGHGGFSLMRKVEPIGDRWPRRTGIPEKRPLW